VRIVASVLLLLTLTGCTEIELHSLKARERHFLMQGIITDCPSKPEECKIFLQRLNELEDGDKM
jgi:hypothetical protein